MICISLDEAFVCWYLFKLKQNSKPWFAHCYFQLLWFKNHKNVCSVWIGFSKACSIGLIVHSKLLGELFSEHNQPWSCIFKILTHFIQRIILPKIWKPSDFIWKNRLFRSGVLKLLHRVGSSLNKEIFLLATFHLIYNHATFLWQLQ